MLQMCTVDRLGGYHASPTGISGVGTVFPENQVQCIMAVRSCCFVSQMDLDIMPGQELEVATEDMHKRIKRLTIGST
jgi:hypothetical protein